jgi:anti-anti-sigma regulatory factor
MIAAALRKYRLFCLADTAGGPILNVPQIDSSGISTLVRISIQLARERGVLRPVCGPGRVRDALTVTRLIETIPAFETESAALANFA